MTAEYLVPLAIPMLGIIALGVAVFKNNKGNDEKVGGIYKRLDAVKDQQDKRYVAKDMCKVIHDYTSKQLLSIETKVDKLLIKNGISHDKEKTS